MPSCGHLDNVRILGLPSSISGCEAWCFVDEAAFVVRRDGLRA